MQNIEIRTMNQNEVPLAIGWAEAEGWNVGTHDAACFYAADPKGFLLATLDGEAAGCISSVSYGPTFGFMGLFIVRPDLRGQGLGKLLWHEAVARLGGRVIGLDSLVERESLYNAMGLKTAHRSSCNVTRAVHNHVSPPEVKHLSHIPFAKACEMDRRHFPADRRGFLDSLVRMPETRSFAYVSDGQVRGWGAIRICKGGWKIGPLLAMSESIAEDLFNGMQNSIPEGADIYLCTPHCNSHAMSLARRHDMHPLFDTLRMYKGEEPALDKKGIYGLAGFELG